MADVDLTADRSRQISVDYGERALGVMVAAKVKHDDFVTTGDAVNAITIPANSFLNNVYFLVTEAWVGGTVVLIVGDDEDPNGYIVAGEIPETDTTVIADARCANAAGLYIVKSDDSTSGRRFYTSADTLDVTFTFTAATTAGEGILIAEIVTIPNP